MQQTKLHSYSICYQIIYKISKKFNFNLLIRNSMVDNLTRRKYKEQKQIEKWLPKIIRVNGIFGNGAPEIESSMASNENKKVTIIEIIEEEGNIGIGGSMYEHVTKRKIEDVLTSRVMKIPLLPIYFYIRK